MSQIFKAAGSSSGVVFSVTGTNGVTASPSTGNVVVSGVDATTSTVGVASFNPSDFTVSGAGQVSLIGGSAAISSVNVQTGTTPVVPVAGAITFNGATVAAGTNPVRTDGTGANTMALEVQFSQAIAATNATNVGLSAFNSGQFTVDSNGFVSLFGGGGQAIQTINSTPPNASGNFNIIGSGSITTVGSANTETVQLTGLTNHAVLVGAGTATITKVGPSATTGQILQNNAAADPSYSTATYPSTTTINQILYSSATNVVSGLATANNGVLTTGTTGTPVITALASNGQLIIGSGSGAPIAATLTAGAGVSIINAANSITIAASGGGFTWSETSGAFAAVKQNGYFITATATGTLPASPTEGDTIKFSVDTASILTLQASAGQTIRFSTAVSATAGTAVNTKQGDSVELVYKSTGTVWIAVNFVGSWTIT